MSLKFIHTLMSQIQILYIEHGNYFCFQETDNTLK